MAPGDIPKEQQPSFDQFKLEGYKNPDGSSYDPDSGIYTRGEKDLKQPHSFKVKSSEEAFRFRKEGYKPFKEAVKVEAQKATGEGIAMQRTEIELGVLKSKMGVNFAELMKAFNLEGQNFVGKIKFDKNIDFSTLKDGFKVKLKPIFNATNLDAVAKLLNDNLKSEIGDKPLNNEEVADFLADIYSSSSVVAVKGAFEKKYPRYVEFENILEDNKSYDFAYKLAITQGSNLNCTFEADKAQQFEVDYQAFDKANPKPVEPTAAEKNLRERAHNFRTSMPGKILASLGLICAENLPEGQTETKEERAAREDKAFEEALNGNNWIAQIAIFLMGGGAMLHDGGKSVAESIAGLDPKYQGLVKGLQAKAPKLLVNMAKDPKYMASVDDVEAATTSVVDKAQFAEMIKDPAKIPADKNLKLKEVTSADGLTIILNDGAEMILPKGKFARINDKQEGSKDEPKHFKGTLAIAGDLPDGTVFKGKVKFQTKIAEQKAV